MSGAPRGFFPEGELAPVLFSPSAKPSVAPKTDDCVVLVTAPVEAIDQPAIIASL